MLKKILSLILCICTILTLVGCGTGNSQDSSVAVESTRTFIDSTGRSIEIPSQIDAVAVTGPMAQMYVFALCPDKLVGISNEWDQSAREYIDVQYLNLPVIGQLYGTKGEINLETLLQIAPQVVIDIGEAKGSIVEDMDSLQEQTGIPFVHIDASLSTMNEAFQSLGELLNLQEQATVLGDYCATVYNRSAELMNAVEKKQVLYITGDQGLNVIAKGSYHAEVIDLMTDNLAVVDDPSSKGTGNEVDMEQLLTWNPDVIIFAPNSVYSSIVNDPNWSGMKAIQSGNYYEVPNGPYNWMGFPPSLQRLLGLMWLENVLYYPSVNYDLKAEITNFYELFYHCELTEDQLNAFFANSIAKVAWN